jgi:hypothetical protein
VEIASVSDFVSACRAYRRKKDSLLLFRGVNKIYPRETRHIPSIYYLKTENEDRIFKEVLAIFPEQMLAQKSTVERLILMQHNRFPTRLMDVSRNPLISLFFACFKDLHQDEKINREDGAVYVYEVPEKEIKYCESDTVSVIANLCRRPYDFSIRDIYGLNERDFNEHVKIVDLVHEIGEEKPHFRRIVKKEHINSVVCLRPRMNNERIVRQDGYFFLFGIDMDKKNCARLNPGWIKEHMVIPSGAKKKLLDELDGLSINQAYVYPDYKYVSDYLYNKYVVLPNARRF